ncbi:MAG: YrvL family regulatory protein [Massiliimalia sp.]
MTSPIRPSKKMIFGSVFLFLLVYIIVCLVLFLLLQLLGIQYQSGWDVVHFFAVYLIFDIPFSILEEAVPKALRASKTVRSTLGYEIVKAGISLPLNGIAVLAADRLTPGVTIPPLSLFFFVLISYMIDWGMEYFSSDAGETSPVPSAGKPSAMIQFRPAQSEDAPQIWELFQQAQAYFREQGINQWQDHYPNPQVIQEDLDRKESFVLQNQNHEIVATAVLSSREEETYREIFNGSWLTDGTYLVIHRVAVRNDQKGQGLASIILMEAQRRCMEQGIPSIRIDTHEDNRSMQRLLEKSGFTRCGIIYLKSGDKRIAFEKQVIPPSASL